MDVADDEHLWCKLNLPFNDLPEDVIRTVHEFSTLRQRLVMECVCKNWYAAATTLWKKFVVPYDFFDESDDQRGVNHDELKKYEKFKAQRFGKISICTLYKQER